MDDKPKYEELEQIIKELEKGALEQKQTEETLEKRMKKLKTELLSANDQLMSETLKRRYEEEEREKLEVRLQQARKMEAVGELVEEVAHALNNILSGLVNFPNLLLMQIEKGSSLRKPIINMQESGEKAAAIVQDLLILAKKDVAVTEVVNLNDIISEYLKSFDCSKLKFNYPELEIETKLEGDLLKISGSPNRLTKIVMHLISNGAEAILDGGTVFITTENRYFDVPAKGYDDISEGDYAVITMSDSGAAVSSEDLERIFEPFYLKKHMGRSGTGLDMAVVWDTVKDHKGYIEVTSTQKKGTTFTLYFPVTKREISKEKDQWSIEDYAGKGESILIVDDIKEQREVASAILTTLGYSVDTVPSGEEAIEYLKKRSADLIVLDMIMPPGMNGRETFEKIVEIYPNQKAIITSGFAATEDVKVAQKLGAGPYVKKPYTLEKIGLVIKKELEE